MKIANIIGTLYLRYRAGRDPIAYARSIGVSVGSDCRFLGLRPTAFGSEPFLVKIGNHVTITSGVKFVTHDGGVWVFREQDADIDVFGPIVVGDNVFIGIDSIILPGVTIGSDVVIGAGSVVTRDVPPRSVVAGIPAKVIRSLDEYREKSYANAVFIRSLPRDRKRRLLLDRYDMSDIK